MDLALYKINIIFVSSLRLWRHVRKWLFVAKDLLNLACQDVVNSIMQDLMCVCVRVCACMCTWVCACVHVFDSFTRLSVYVCVYVLVPAFVSMCLILHICALNPSPEWIIYCTYMHVHMLVRMHIHPPAQYTHTRMHARTHARPPARTHRHTHILVHTYIRHTYIDTYVLKIW